jgi:hypothetical protein
VSDDDFLRVEANDCPMSSCAAPAGSPCRTGKGRVAVQYHTARFRLVPHLAKTLNVPAPAVRKPGSVWVELPRPAAAGAEPAGHVRIGYARASTVRQSLDTQLDSLKAAGVTRIFSEKISTRATSRPELGKAAVLARELRASGVAVTLVVHEHKRLGRGIELAALAEQLKTGGIGLEFLAGELQGSHDPSGIVFCGRRTTVCATSPPGWSSPGQEEGPAAFPGHRAADAARARRESRRGSSRAGGRLTGGPAFTRRPRRWHPGRAVRGWHPEPGRGARSCRCRGRPGGC